VEDTINLVGHALRKVLGVLAGQQGWGLAAAERARLLAGQAGIGVLAGSSVKAALDLDWDAATARERAVEVVLDALVQVEQLVAAWAGGDDPRVADALAAAVEVRDQDVTTGQDGVARIAKGVARDRRISIEDAQMRHGRKTKSVRIDGYKRHVLRDLDSQLVCSVGLTPANLPEAEVAGQVQADLDAQGVRLVELHIDRAYLASVLVRDRDQELEVDCKAFPVRAAGGRFAKPAFTIDSAQHTLTCPNSIQLPFTPGGKVQFPAQACAACPCARSAPPARVAAACSSTPMSGCWSSCAPGSRPPMGAPGCASVSRSSTRWPMSAAGRATAHATSDRARTCSTYAGSRSSTTSTSSPANPDQPTKPPEPGYLTGSLGRGGDLVYVTRCVGAVGVGEYHQLARCRQHPASHGEPLAMIRFGAKHPHARVADADRMGDRAGGIGRAVVDHQHLDLALARAAAA
jgi:hypothetical protein